LQLSVRHVNRKEPSHPGKMVHNNNNSHNKHAGQPSYFFVGGFSHDDEREKVKDWHVFYNHPSVLFISLVSRHYTRKNWLTDSIVQKHAQN